MQLEYTSNEHLETVFQLKKTIKELRELQYILNRKANQNQLDETTHKDCHDAIKQVIDSKTWCILEHIDRLESDIKNG